MEDFRRRCYGNPARPEQPARIGNRSQRSPGNCRREPATMPLVSRGTKPSPAGCSITETAYAAVRKPPGKGPFPAVVFLHGGLGQSEMETLVKNAIHQPAQARFLAWGYVTVNATRRRHPARPRRPGCCQRHAGDNRSQ